jgi:hypothetical protein
MCDTPRDMILIAAAPLIQKAPVRHSGEGRNPPISSSRGRTVDTGLRRYDEMESSKRLRFPIGTA